eukprot:1469408-Ditylum_brightwellii.AAC.1
MIINYNGCGAPHCIYSKHVAGSCVLPVGPTDEQWEAFQNEMENGHRSVAGEAANLGQVE